jgi:hypothetical protein
VAPTGPEREDALLCSTAFLTPDQLRGLQARIRRGEPLQPSAALRRAARDRLTAAPPEPAALSNAQLAALGAANLLFTPLLGWAVWFRYRARPGPGGTQALLVTLPVSLVLLGGLLYWRLRLLPSVE